LFYPVLNTEKSSRSTKKMTFVYQTLVTIYFIMLSWWHDSK